MIKLKKSHKILSLLLLGSILISILILPNISNTTNPTSDQKSPTQDDIPPKLSAPAPTAIYNQTFNITQSEDDAYSSRLLIAPPTTRWGAKNISLGYADRDDPLPNVAVCSLGIALRWNITVPKKAHITKAYINLTVANLTFWGLPWTGFNTSISAFNEASTNNFSDPDEVLWNRQQIGDLPWELNGTEDINQTLQTNDVSSLVEDIMALDDWDGIFGAWITSGVGTLFGETIQFWSYDYGKPEYYPKLFVEWEESGPNVSIISPITDTYGPYSLSITASITETLFTVLSAKTMINASTPFNISMNQVVVNTWSCVWNNISDYLNGDYKITIWAIDVKGHVNQAQFVVITIDKSLIDSIVSDGNGGGGSGDGDKDSIEWLFIVTIIVISAVCIMAVVSALLIKKRSKPMMMPKSKFPKMCPICSKKHTEFWILCKECYDKQEKSPISIICPTCKSKKNIEIPKFVIEQAKQITTISIPRELMCGHHFQAFVDKDFKVRGYQKVDFEGISKQILTKK